MIIRYFYNKTPKRKREDFAFGLAGGFMFGLAFGLAGGFLNNNPYLAIIGIAILALSEIFFWLEKDRPRKRESKIHFTIKRKAENLFESALIIVNLFNIEYVVRNYGKSISEFFGAWWYPVLSFMGWGTLIIGIIAGFVYLNSLKYRRKA